MMRSGAESGGAEGCTSPTGVVPLFTCEPVLRPYRCIVADCVFGCHVDRVAPGTAPLPSDAAVRRISVRAPDHPAPPYAAKNCCSERIPLPRSMCLGAVSRAHILKSGQDMCRMERRVEDGRGR